MQHCTVFFLQVVYRVLEEDSYHQMTSLCTHRDILMPRSMQSSKQCCSSMYAFAIAPRIKSKLRMATSICIVWTHLPFLPHFVLFFLFSQPFSPSNLQMYPEDSQVPLIYLKQIENACNLQQVGEENATQVVPVYL